VTPIDYALYPGAGALLGALYFVLVFRTARLHTEGAAASRIIPLYALRIGLAVAAFWAIAQQGAMPLLLALLGFLIARMLVQSRLGLR
jgi:F1F0 ATPase subunit 2